VTGSRIRALLLVALGFALGAIAVGGAIAARYVTGGDTEVSSTSSPAAGFPISAPRTHTAWRSCRRRSAATTTPASMTRI
jgi:hypothetical protein